MRNLSIVMTFLVLFGVFEARAADSRVVMCTRLDKKKSNFAEDSYQYNDLHEEWKAECLPPPGMSEVEDNNWWAAKYPRENENPNLNAVPTLATSERENAARVEAALGRSSENREVLFDDCKTICATSDVKCRGSIAQAKSVADADFQRVRGLLNGNEASVTQGCNSISNYQATAESQMNPARSSCDTDKSQCDQVCTNAREKSNSVPSPMPNGTNQSNWMTMNERAGAAYSQAISTAVANAQAQISSDVQALNNQCTSAKQQLAQAKIDKEKAKKDEAQNKQTNNQLGNALQSLASQFAGQDGSQLPYDPGFGQQPYAPPVDNPTQYTAPNNLGAVKGDPDFNSSGRYDDAGILDGGLGGLPPHQRKPHGQNPQQGGGGSAGVGGGGGGQAAGNKAKARGGRSRLDADVYKGAMSGGGTPSGQRGGDGYPTEGQKPGGRGRARVAAADAAAKRRMVNLQKFLPQRLAVRRGVANTTGPDGITGPHTDLFKKVRTRYLETVFND